MCGFDLYLFNREITEDEYTECSMSARKISHRGPDSFVTKLINNKIFLGFARLMVNGMNVEGDQPFIKYTEEKTYYCMCNGEIYNYKEVNEICGKDPNEKSSDCKYLIDLYIKLGYRKFNTFLDSEHAIVILEIDNNTNEYTLFISNDRFGIRPLFMGTSSRGVFLSSELDGLPKFDLNVTRVAPREYSIVKNGQIIENEEYFNLNIEPYSMYVETYENSQLRLREAIKTSVCDRLHSDNTLGAFLSGGEDSSVVCYEASLELNKTEKILDTFSTGIYGGEDEIYAKIASEEFNTNHLHFPLSKETFVNRLPEVVKCEGSFDITTVRASIGQYSISKDVAEKTNTKVLLSGDGADEIFFSYDDHKYCPSDFEFRKRMIHLVENIHTSDGLRADRCTSRFGLELRVPFLSRNVATETFLTPTEYLFQKGRNVSKPLLRDAYKGLISDKINYRNKVTFSDGMGSKEDQIQTLISDYFKDMYTKEELDRGKLKYAYHCPPETNEGLFYRNTFHEHFGDNESIARTIPFFWKPIFKQSSDPSAWFTEAV